MSERYRPEKQHHSFLKCDSEEGIVFLKQTTISPNEMFISHSQGSLLPPPLVFQLSSCAARMEAGCCAGSSCYSTWMSCTQRQHRHCHITTNAPHWNANATKAYCLIFVDCSPRGVLNRIRGFKELNLLDNVMFVWGHFGRWAHSISQIPSLAFFSSLVRACYQGT